jgi:hypothetical protein
MKESTDLVSNRTLLWLIYLGWTPAIVGPVLLWGAGVLLVLAILALVVVCLWAFGSWLVKLPKIMAIGRGLDRACDFKHHSQQIRWKKTLYDVERQRIARSRILDVRVMAEPAPLPPLVLHLAAHGCPISPPVQLTPPRRQQHTVLFAYVSAIPYA